MERVGERCFGQRSVQLTWVWQAWQPASPETARSRSRFSFSRTSLKSVQARFSAALDALWEFRDREDLPKDLRKAINQAIEVLDGGVGELMLASETAMFDAAAELFGVRARLLAALGGGAR